MAPTPTASEIRLRSNGGLRDQTGIEYTHLARHPVPTRARRTTTSHVYTTQNTFVEKRQTSKMALKRRDASPWLSPRRAAERAPCRCDRLHVLGHVLEIVGHRLGVVLVAMAHKTSSSLRVPRAAVLHMDVAVVFIVAGRCDAVILEQGGDLVPDVAAFPLLEDEELGRPRAPRAEASMDAPCSKRCCLSAPSRPHLRAARACASSSRPVRRRPTGARAPLARRRSVRLFETARTTS